VHPTQQKTSLCKYRNDQFWVQLVALVVGEFGRIQCNNGTRAISVYAPLGSESQGSFALETANAGLSFFETLFKSPYMLPKLDLVAIPDFAAGAMENWGLMTFKTTKLLRNTTKTDLSAEKSIADAVLHEISHQWLGNLVTMETWASLWLKESLATWMAHYARSRLFVTHGAWLEFVTDWQQTALEMDALRNSHPIEDLQSSKDESVQIFDDISYRKGCSMILMLAQAVGEENFFEGIRTYLSRYAFSSASSEDFWAAVEETNGSKIGAQMRVWTRKQGFPVVTVTESREAGNSAPQMTHHQIHISQNRFLTAGNMTIDEDEVIYPLQISIRFKDSVQELPFFARNISFSIPDSAIFKFNVDHHGFYRTLYPKDHFRRLAQAHGEGWLSVEDRVGILSDATALAKAGLQNVGDFLDLIIAMQYDTDYHVWVQIVKSITAIRSAWIFGDDDVFVGLGHFFQDILKRKMGKDGGSVMENRDLSDEFKALLLRASGEAGTPT
jgi:aminopeptidase 2